MTHEQLFLNEGAAYFGNRLIWKHKDVGMKLPGSALVLNLEGEDAIKRLENITDVEPKPRKAAKAKAESAPVEADPAAELDDLLGQ